MRFSKIISIFLAMCFIILPITAFAEEAEMKPVIVGYEPGYGMVDNATSVDSKGYGHELLEQMRDYVNFDFEFVAYDVGESIEALKNGDIDIAGPVFAQEVNAEEFGITAEAIGSAQHVLATNSTTKRFYDDKHAIDGKTVMTYEANPANEFFEEYLYTRGIEVELKYGQKADYFLEEADYYLINTNNANIPKDFYSVLNLGASDLHLLTSTSNALLTEALDELIFEATNSEGDLLSELYQKYYGNLTALTTRGLTSEESSLLQGKQFTVGYMKDHEPYQYTNEEGEATGVNVEILNELAEKYGFFLEYVEYDPNTVLLNNLGADILITTLGNPELLLQDFRVTNAYSTVPLYMIVEEGGSTQSVEDIAMVEYSTLSRDEVAAEYPGSSVKVYNDFTDAIAAFDAGNADAIVFTNTQLTAELLAHIDSKVHSTTMGLPFCLFVSKEMANEYVGIFNVIFNTISDEYYFEVEAQQVAVITGQDAYTVEDFMKTYWPVILIGVLIIVLIGIAYALHQQSLREKAIRKALEFDELTGLPSMHRTVELSTKMLAKSSAEEYELVTVDIDYFRLINTLYGMEAGEKVIKIVAECLSSTYKEKTALITRVYADQFFIIKKSSEGKNIVDVCEEVIAPEIHKIVGESFSLSMSAGICKIKDSSDSISVVFDRANVAKAKGKSRHSFTCHFFDEQMEGDYSNRMSVTHKMDQALENKEFIMYYQPKVSLESLQICGAEALVRWAPPDEDMIRPDLFIPVFEANGFITNLDMYVFDSVCAFISANSSKVKIPHVSVNLSAVSLADDQLCDKLGDILKKYELAPEKIEIELTESAMVEELENTPKRIEELKSAGFAISIDDFGKGTSSLGKLSSIDIDILKLDKDFLDFRDQKKGAVVVEDMIRMAKRLDITVVSECIETAEQAGWLKSLGCDMAQGYYFEKPLTPEDFLAVLTKNQVYQI